MAAQPSTSASVSPSEVVVHPLVLLSVVDHADRVNSGVSKRRVAGILLGDEQGGKINISNSFAVPFEEAGDAKSFYIDLDFCESMYNMHKKVSARERILGWYHSGPRLRASDLEINELVKRFHPNPVMLIVQCQQQEGIPVDAYRAVEEIKEDGTAAQRTFNHIPSSIGAEEAEEIGVEHLLRDIKDLDTGTLSSRVANQLQSLQGLQARLAEIKQYLEQVVKGELPVNHEITNNLQNVFNLLPNLEVATGGATDEKRKTSSVATIATNDQLLVMYLSSLIRAVIALHDLVNNKLEMSSTHDVARALPFDSTAKPAKEENKAGEQSGTEAQGL